MAALALLPLTLACFTFAEYPEASVVAPPTPRSLDVTVSEETYSGGQRHSPEVVRSLSESGLFASVVEGGSAGELEAEVAVKTQKSKIHGPTFLAFFTFFLVPTQIDYQVAVHLKVRDRRTGRAALSDKSFGFRTWYQLFLAPLYFVYSPETFETDLTSALTREAAAECLAAVSAPPGP